MVKKLKENYDPNGFAVTGYLKPNKYGVYADRYFDANDWSGVESYAHDLLMQGLYVNIINFKNGSQLNIDPTEYQAYFDGDFDINNDIVNFKRELLHNECHLSEKASIEDIVSGKLISLGLSFEGLADFVDSFSERTATKTICKQLMKKFKFTYEEAKWILEEWFAVHDLDECYLSEGNRNTEEQELQEFLQWLKDENIKVVKVADKLKTIYLRDEKDLDEASFYLQDRDYFKKLYDFGWHVAVLNKSLGRNLAKTLKMESSTSYDAYDGGVYETFDAEDAKEAAKQTFDYMYDKYIKTNQQICEFQMDAELDTPDFWKTFAKLCAKNNFEYHIVNKDKNFDDVYYKVELTDVYDNFSENYCCESLTMKSLEKLLFNFIKTNPDIEVYDNYSDDGVDIYSYGKTDYITLAKKFAEYIKQNNPSEAENIELMADAMYDNTYAVICHCGKRKSVYFNFCTNTNDDSDSDIYVGYTYVLD